MSFVVARGGRRPWTRQVPLVALGLALALGCGKKASMGDPDLGPDGDMASPGDPPAVPVDATFTLKVNPADEALTKRTQQQPIASPATVSGQSDALGLTVHVHREAQRPTRLWLEIYVENRKATPLRDLRLRLKDLKGADAVVDVNEDPFATAPLGDGQVLVGGVGPEGIGHVSLALTPSAGATEVSASVVLSATVGKGVAQTSAPLALTGDGQELWTAVPDADQVVVVDARSDQRVAQVAVPGGPTSVAVTPDGAQVLVASARGNTVTVIDRAARKISQTLGEADGIGRDPRHLALSPDGKRAYISAYVGDAVTVLEQGGGRWQRKAVIPVGRRPVGLAVTPDGGTVLVSHFMPRGKITENYGLVSVLRTDTLTLAREAILDDDGNVKPAECYATQFNLPKERAVDLSAEAVPTQLAGVFLTPGGAEGWVAGGKAAGVIPVWEGDVAKVGLGPITALFMPGFLFVLDTRAAQQAGPKAHPGVIDYPDAPEATLKCLRPSLAMEAVVRRPSGMGAYTSAGAAFGAGVTPLSETSPARFVAFSRGGRRALALSYASDELMVQDAITHHPVTQRHLLLAGSNPTGLVLSPDGKKGYVAYENSLFVSVLDLSTYADTALPGPSYVPYELKIIAGPPASLFSRAQVVRYYDDNTVPDRPAVREVGKVTLVDKDPVDPVVRRGKILFNSSNPERYPQLTVNREGSCSGCHPNGGNDGSVWGTMEGERRTVALWGGVAGRGWLHQSATHIDADDFVRTIIPERLGGKNTSDDDFKAIATYLARGIPRPQSPKVDQALADRGKALFASKCAGCHSGASFTSGNADPNNPYGGGAAAGPRLFDVGTASDTSRAVMGPLITAMLPPATKTVFDLTRGDRKLGTGDPLQMTLSFRQRPDRARGQVKAPSLVGVWDNSLFFHDGRFDKIEDAVAYLNTRLSLGLSADDQKAVIEYLKTL